MHSSLTVVCTILAICFGFSLQSEESAFPTQLNAVVSEGKRLKLNVENVFYPGMRWRLNGEPVSEKCEITVTANSSILICPAMDRVDEGRYEYQGIREDGQSETLLVVDVKVVECTEELTAKPLADDLREAPSDECFCSGITDQCWKARNLFRSQIAVNVTEADMIDLKIRQDVVEEEENEDSLHETFTYYALPRNLTGNLLKSYGGYLEFPTNDDGVDEDGPDVVLKGRRHDLVYHNPRLLVSEEHSTTRIHMTENSWYQLDGSSVSKQTFMAVLSKVKSFYIKCNQFRRTDPLTIVLDSAVEEDLGMGPVATVEECNCRTGYAGLSCEGCTRGYYRRQAVGIQGICVSIKEKWESMKATLGWRHRMEQLRNVV
ncbi:basement membrane proteoglycan-like [Topomyia yanbarensis]|uniref:basement membrane proteoglycan-like n=1 Tax=Topomyia yanbarensis TaxID=2498891 RepID=UPI00273BEDCE|nr:basement membrane proteoglycan-like [Topomyia yanbarensis]